MDSNIIYDRFFKRIMSCLKQEAKKKDGKMTIEEIERFASDFQASLDIHIIANIKCERNKNGIPFHPATGITFDFSNPFAYANGKLENNELKPLNIKAVQICAANGWIFDDSNFDDELKDYIKDRKDIRVYAKSRIEKKKTKVEK